MSGSGGRPWRRRFLLAAWLLAGAGLLGRAVQVQVVQGPVWERVAERQHRRSLEVPAPRGGVLDRSGSPLAVSHERMRVSVAPREVQDPDETATLLARTLDLAPAAARRIVRSADPWVVLPGRYPPAIRERLEGVRGVYLERELERIRPHDDLALGLLGRVRDGAGSGGIEQAFDSLLAGRPGREVQARDHQGRAIPGESYRVRPPRPGGEVVLTLDLDLQEIGREALARAVEDTDARGGDLLITDPRTGEILSMVSVRGRERSSLSAISTPYEPGSILKPFTVAGLLARDLASLSDTVDAGEGSWTVAGRTLNDVRSHEEITLADALRVSSNVGVARAATAFSPAQQYKTLRDFGFGAPTGIDLPGESPGTLRRPESWSTQSPASLAIGYEIAVTPLQMAMAYGALANGGWLMEPRLVKEIRGPEGAVLERRGSRRIRRVIPASVSRKLTDILVDVVEDGTGTAAQLSSFRVAGKSGTSRAYGEGGYERGSYFSSFVGFFPAEDPQLVVFVKLERPRGEYYGGATAGPVTRATLEAILAARRGPLDRSALAKIARPVPARAPQDPVRLASYRVHGAGGDGGRAPSVRPEVEQTGRVPVPDVSGLPLRVAVRRLHTLGFRVRWEGSGRAVQVRPAPGARLARGDTVRLGGHP